MKKYSEAKKSNLANVGNVSTISTSHFFKPQTTTSSSFGPGGRVGTLNTSPQISKYFSSKLGQVSDVQVVAKPSITASTHEKASTKITNSKDVIRPKTAHGRSPLDSKPPALEFQPVSVDDRVNHSSIPKPSFMERKRKVDSMQSKANALKFPVPHLWERVADVGAKRYLGPAEMYVKEDCIDFEVVNGNNTIILDKDSIAKLSATNAAITDGFCFSILQKNRTNYLGMSSDSLSTFKHQLFSALAFSPVMTMSDTELAELLNTIEKIDGGTPKKSVITRSRATRSEIVNQKPKEIQHVDLVGDENGSGRRKSARLSEIAPPATNNEYSALIRLFKYPPDTKFSLSVREHDLHRLNEGEFLNDTVIEFYLRYLQQQRDYPDTYFFNTFFYSQLTRKGGKSSEDFTFGYEKVKSWTSKVDIFRKKYLVVPINERLECLT
jgi:hypothetical protein